MSDASDTDPCVEICVMNRVSGLCSGCHRTQNEISNWHAYSNEMRASILLDLEERAKTTYV